MTTNNRMELLGVVVALDMLKSKPMDVTIFRLKICGRRSRKSGFLAGKKYFKNKKNSFMGAFFTRL